MKTQWAARIRFGACRGMDTGLFYPLPGEDHSEAKAVCASCVIREACLEWGLRNEKFGIWGGASERDRRRIRRGRGPTLSRIA